MLSRKSQTCLLYPLQCLTPISHPRRHQLLHRRPPLHLQPQEGQLGQQLLNHSAATIAEEARDDPGAEPDRAAQDQEAHPGERPRKAAGDCPHRGDGQQVGGHSLWEPHRSPSKF